MSLIGDRISVLIRVEPFLALMGKVGGYNHIKQLGVSSVIVGQITVGAVGGWIYAAVARKPWRNRFSLGLFVILPVILFALALWPALWRLEIAGLVKNKHTYSIDELRALPSITQETTLIRWRAVRPRCSRSSTRKRARASAPLDRVSSTAK